MTQLRNMYLHDGYGNPIGSADGALNVHDPAIHTQVVNRQFTQDTATTTTFAVDAPAGSTQITLTSAVGFAIGDYLTLVNGGTEGVKPLITNLVGTVATLNRPIDFGFVIGDSIIKTLVSMDVLGTLTTPQSFKIAPDAGSVWHITRILIEMTHATAGDNGLFGNLAALANGVVLRRYDGLTSTYGTFTVWRTNSDIVLDMYDVTYAARSGGGGLFGTNCRGDFLATGAVVKLDGDNGDYLELLIQDDLTGLDSFGIRGQGHFEAHA